MSYWGRIFVHAVREAAKYTKLDTLANAVTTVVVQIVVSIILWISFDYVWPTGALMTRVLATVTPFLAFPVAFVIQFFVAPPEMAKRDAIRLASLEDDLKAKERRETVKDIIGRHIDEGNKIFGHPAIKQGDAMNDAAEQWVTKTHNFISAAFGSGEAALFLSDAGYTFYSSNGVVGNWIVGRLRRLNELLPRIDAMEIDKDFDPTIWS